MAHIPVDPKSKGVERQFRLGSPLYNGEGQRGVNTEANPGDLRPNELQWAKDIRIVGGRTFTRAPLGLVASLRDIGPELQGDNSYTPVMWMHPDPSDNPRSRLWATVLGCQGATVGTGSTVFHVDPMEVPSVQDYAQFFSTNDRYTPQGQYGTDLYIGVKDSIFKVLLLPPVQGVQANQIVQAPTVLPILRFKGFTVSFIEAHGSDLVIGLIADTSPDTTSKVVVWNSQSVTEELTGVGRAVAAHIFQDSLVVGFDATAGHVRVRSASGSWTTIAAVGFGCAPYGSVMAEERDSLFIASGAQNIWKLRNGALTTAHVVGAAENTAFGVTALVTCNGEMIYGWNKPAAGYLSFIGRHDPDSTIDAAHEWVDEYAPLTAQVAAFAKLTSMALFKQQVYCGGWGSGLIAVPQSNLRGTPQIYRAPSGILNNLLQLVRYPA